MAKNNAGSICSFTSVLLLSALVAGISIVWSIINAAPYTRVVQTKSGPIRGEELIFEGTHYKAFKGIPYAAPPLRDLRFKSPEPPKKWTEVRDTRDYGKICPQSQRVFTQIRMDVLTILEVGLIKNARNTVKNIIRMHTSSEDCLTLNVFTPSLGERGLKPVLVFIHGGGFYAGDGTDGLYGVEYLMQQDIVVVTFNYRLGPLGFLATGTADAPGNYGLKDQVLALKWVQDNIKNFGGDPNKVTIFGNSAGGASVHLHQFSPLSKGLFHRAVATSGSATSTWAIIPDQNKFNQNLAKILGASKGEVEDPAKRVQFLRSADAQAMSDAIFDVVQGEEASNPFMDFLPFVPVIEPAGTKGAFLTEDPKKLIHEGNFTKVPLMMGATDLEGAVFYIGFAKDASNEAVSRNIDAVEKNLCRVILAKGLREGLIANNDCSNIAQQVREAYFEGKPFNSSTLKYWHFFGDLMMIAEIHHAQRQHAIHSTKDAPIYSYFFTFDGEWNGFKKIFLPSVPLPGAVHGDDLFYVFKPTLLALPTLTPSAREVITKDRMISFLTNFVKYGNPTPFTSDLIPFKWEAATAKEPKTLFIGDDLKMEKEFLKTRIDMWDGWYKKYAKVSLYS